MSAPRELREPSRITWGPPRSESMPRGLDFHDESLGNGSISVAETSDKLFGAHVIVEFLDLKPPQTITLNEMEWAARPGVVDSQKDPGTAMFLIREAARALPRK